MTTWNVSVPDGVQVLRVAIKCHINGIPSNIQFLVMKWLMDIADELDELMSMRSDYVVYFLAHEGSRKDMMSCFRAETHVPWQW